jgi:hypothetical protein
MALEWFTAIECSPYFVLKFSNSSNEVEQLERVSQQNLLFATQPLAVFSS